MIFREFFYLRKSDRQVILTLLCVIVLALVVIYLAGGENNVSNSLAEADSLRQDSVSQRSQRRFAYHRVDTIYLKPRYVRYSPRSRSGSRQPSGSVASADSSIRSTFQPRHKIGQGEHIVLNTADTTELMCIPGIGPYYARQIVRYGHRLGGYVCVDQLDEIGDVPPEAKQYLVIENPQPRLLNVNRLSLNELRRHPYINFYQAKAITDYRRLHGNLRSLNDLHLLKDFPPEVIDRLEPYVEY